MEKLSIGIAKAFLSTPIYLAREKGFFADEGIDITIREYPSGKLATRAMFAGEVDVSTVADMPIVFNGCKKKNFCILATFTSSYHSVKMIARKDKGIKSAADLKGKRVGANERTSSHFYLGAFLTDNRMSMADVEMVHYKTVDLADALINKEVDAVSIWQPYDQKPRTALGDTIVDLSTREIYRTTFSLAVKKDFTATHRPVLEKLIRALDKAAEFSKSNREESIEIIAGIFDLDKGIVASTWNDFRFGTYLDQAMLIGLDDIARWAMENGFIDQQAVPNFLDHICPDLLVSVKPEQCTIIR